MTNDLLFYLVPIAIVAAFFVHKKISKDKNKVNGTDGRNNQKIKACLSRIQASKMHYNAVSTMRIMLRDNLTNKSGKKLNGMALLESNTMILDANFVETKEQLAVIRLILHEAGHLVLKHKGFSRQQEDAANLYAQEGIFHIEANS